MKKEHIATFEEDYPYLCREVRFETRDGWYDLLRNLFAAVHDEVTRLGVDKEKVTFTQIKEKFSMLTAYYTCSDAVLNDSMSKLTHIYGIKSLEVCELCGEKGSRTTDKRWERTLCRPCKKKEGRK